MENSSEIHFTRVATDCSHRQNDPLIKICETAVGVAKARYKKALSGLLSRSC